MAYMYAIICNSSVFNLNDVLTLASLSISVCLNCLLGKYCELLFIVTEFTLQICVIHFLAKVIVI